MLLCLNEEINEGAKFGVKLPWAKFANIAPPQQQYEQRAAQLKDRDSSRVTEIFQSVLGTTVWCTNCHKPKHIFNSDMVLSIDLHDGLSKFFDEELVGEDEKLKCEWCQTKSQVRKKVELFDLPQVLTLQLKRFLFSQETLSYDKMEDPVLLEK